MSFHPIGTADLAGALQMPASPVTQITPLTPADFSALDALHDDVFGPGRFARTAYRVREGAPFLSEACFKLTIDGVLQGAVQMTWITVGGGAMGMLLGPLVVATPVKNCGHGQALMATAIEKAGDLGGAYVILVGDLPYYERAGFAQVPPGTIQLPGPVDPNRLLIRMLSPSEERPKGELRAVKRLMD